MLAHSHKETLLTFRDRAFPLVWNSFTSLMTWQRDLQNQLWFHECTSFVCDSMTFETFRLCKLLQLLADGTSDRTWLAWPKPYARQDMELNSCWRVMLLKFRRRLRSFKCSCLSDPFIITNLIKSLNSNKANPRQIAKMIWIDYSYNRPVIICNFN